MGLSFGYNANEGDDKLISVPDLISLLVGTVANNGNLLLNIGPKADGTIPEEQVAANLNHFSFLLLKEQIKLKPVKMIAEIPKNSHIYCLLKFSYPALL